MLGKFGFHSGSESEGLMNTHKIAIDKMNSKHGVKALQPLGKGICEPQKSVHFYMHVGSD